MGQWAVQFKTLLFVVVLWGGGKGMEGGSSN